jgi:hypothetical protein
LGARPATAGRAGGLTAWCPPAQPRFPRTPQTVTATAMAHTVQARLWAGVFCCCCCCGGGRRQQPVFLSCVMCSHVRAPLALPPPHTHTRVNALTTPHHPLLRGAAPPRRLPRARPLAHPAPSPSPGPPPSRHHRHLAPSNFGVAKRANVTGVRVLDCGGSGSDLSVIRGIEWVRAQPNTVRLPPPLLRLVAWLARYAFVRLVHASRCGAWLRVMSRMRAPGPEHVVLCAPSAPPHPAAVCGGSTAR